MTELPPDDRLISGAVVTAEMWFELDDVAVARTFGLDTLQEPGSVSFQFSVTPQCDVALEGPTKALSALSGQLHVSSQRERTGRLGRLCRDADGYSIWINLFESELDRFLRLLGLGLRPRALRLEFDIEVAQWVDDADYWDDARYPRVDIHEYCISWSPRPGPPARVGKTSRRQGAWRLQ
jgi:hypothetical protein